MSLYGVETSASPLRVGKSGKDNCACKLLISDGGTLVRTRVEEISTLGRNTQGVTLIRVGDDENLVGLAKVVGEEDEEEGEEESEEESGEEE